MKIFSRQLKRNGARHRNTASGRASSIRTSATITAGTMLSSSRCGDDQQPEQHEHHDLRQPGRGIEERHHRIMRPRRPVADDDAGEIDREKSGAMRDLRRAEDHQRRGRDKGRMQALRQRHAIERQHHQAAADHADDGAEHGLAGEFQRDMRRPSFRRSK